MRHARRIRRGGTEFRRRHGRVEDVEMWRGNESHDRDSFTTPMGVASFLFVEVFAVSLYSVAAITLRFHANRHAGRGC